MVMNNYESAPELVDPSTNLVKSICEVCPELAAPYVPTLCKAMHTKLTDNTRYLLTLAISYIANAPAACQILLQQEKHMAVIQLACAMIADADTGRAQQGLKLFTALVNNLKDFVCHYSSQLSQLLLAGVTTQICADLHPSVTMLRYFELACHLSSASPSVFKDICEPTLTHVFD